MCNLPVRGRDRQALPQERGGDALGLCLYFLIRMVAKTCDGPLEICFAAAPGSRPTRSAAFILCCHPSRELALIDLRTV